MKTLVLVSLIAVLSIFFTKTYAISGKKHNKSIKLISQTNQKQISEFDTTLTKIPQGYRGINPVLLYNSIENKFRDILRKNQYETTASYLTRIKNELSNPIKDNYTHDSIYEIVQSNEVMLSKPLIGKLTQNNIFAFNYPLKTTLFKYNADKENISFTINLMQLEVGRHSRIGYKYLPRSITLKEIEEDQNYIASNAFGVTKKITNSNKQIYCLAIDNWKCFENAFEGNESAWWKEGIIECNIHASPILAEQIIEKNLLKCIVIGNLSSQLINDYTKRSSPATILDPYEFTDNYKYIYFKIKEIWFYNDKTGEIYLKMKAKSPNTALQAVLP